MSASSRSLPAGTSNGAVTYARATTTVHIGRTAQPAVIRMRGMLPAADHRQRHQPSERLRCRLNFSNTDRSPLGLFTL